MGCRSRSVPSDRARGGEGPVASERAVYMTEALLEIDNSYDILSYLTQPERLEVLAQGTPRDCAAGRHAFVQGEPHEGIYLIHAGRVRNYYVSPSGREIILAYWTSGHFIGGPEIFGGGRHVWSAMALEDCSLTFLAADKLKRLALKIPNLAIGLVQGLVFKGKCYSALLQILATQPATGRLAHLLLTLAQREGALQRTPMVLGRRITHDELANMVGATRQWVTASLQRFRKMGCIALDRERIVILDKAKLRQVYD